MHEELGRRAARTCEENSTEEGAQNAMRRTSRLTAGCCITMVRSLQEWHSPEEALQIQRDLLRVWSRERGEMMRAVHARGFTITPANFVREMDRSSKYVWDLEDEAVTSDR